MKGYVLSTCSTVDLSVERLAERKISWKSFHYFMDGKEYFDDMFSNSMSMKDFYDSMVRGAMTRTSQINTEEYCEYFEELFADHDEIVHVTLSSGLSGSFNSARIAVEMLKEKYPDKNVYLVDSLCASGGHGLLVELLADKRDEGVSAKELYEYAEKIKLNVRLDFYSTDLTFYVRGGRVSKVAGLVGNILKICPVLDVNSEGKLVVRKKAHGKVKAAEELLETMTANALNGVDYDGRCIICHSNCLVEANRLIGMIEGRFENLKGKIDLYPIGPTIGSHSGPGTVALFYFGNERGE